MPKRFLAATLLAGLAAPPAMGQIAAPDTVPPPDPRGTLSLTVENDLFGGGTDRNYTNGLLMTWRSPSADLPRPLAWVDAQADWLLGPGNLRWGLSIGQNIYTPQNTAAAIPNPLDRPYAGHLYGAVTLSRQTERTQTILELQAGVVGPSALGDQVQNGWHRFIGVDTAKGWDAQLKDEAVVDLLAERRWRIATGTIGGIPAEIIPEVALSIGNAATYGSAGGLFRIGTALDSDWGPVRIRPALAGSGFIRPRDEFGWYVFAGIEGRAVGRDIFLDGNTWQSGPRVDKRLVVGDLLGGAAVLWRGMRLAYTQIVRSEEFYGQRGVQAFGSISLSVRF